MFIVKNVIRLNVCYYPEEMPKCRLSYMEIQLLSTYIVILKYLGLTIHKNGKFLHTIKERISKANRAICMLRHVLIIGHSGHISVKMAMSLFDKKKSPILLYSCDLIWAIPDSNRHLYIY